VATLHALHYIVMSMISGAAIVVRRIGVDLAARFDAITLALKKVPF
jgi:hypothetical protein